MDIYSILEASDISLIILLDKEASMNNITLIIWEIEKIFWPVKKVLLKIDYTNRYSNEAYICNPAKQLINSLNRLMLVLGKIELLLLKYA